MYRNKGLLWAALTATLLTMAACAVLVSGCASLGGQADVSLAGRGLILVDQYNALEATYKSHYRYSSPEVREVMRQRVGLQPQRLRDLGRPHALRREAKEKPEEGEAAGVAERGEGLGRADVFHDSRMQEWIGDVE
jgi:hypothetical protein